MNIRRKFKIVICCIITAGLALSFLCYSTNLMRLHKREELNTFFTDQQGDYDVIFIGNSHIKYGVSPMELWNDYGIVSYNAAVQSQILPTAYWQIENLLDYTSPKLIVIDCFYLSAPDKIRTQSHRSLDRFPLSRTKIEAVFDLLENEDTDLTHMEFLWDYSLYHNRWNELTEEDFEWNDNGQKGANYVIDIMTGNQMTKIPRENKLAEDAVGVVYLKRIIENCQSRGIDILLTYMPFPAGEEAQKEANTVYDIAAQYGVNYINFLDMDLINYDTDCSDDTHINLSGCRKVTDYLGQYITEHYNITDQRNNEIYSTWHTDYSDYRNALLADMSGYESLDYRLLFLYDRNFLTFIEINDHSIWNNFYYVNLLENLGIKLDMVTQDTDFFIVQDAGQQVSYLENFRESNHEIVTESGKIQVFSTETGTYGVYLNDRELYTVTPEQSPETAVRIVIVDKNTLEVIDQSAFSYNQDPLRLYRAITD